MSDRWSGEPGEPTGPDAVPSQLDALRTFLRSSTGGALVSVAAVLLIVAILLVVRGRPSQSTERASDGSATRATPTATAAPSESATTAGGPATTPPVRTSAAPTTTKPAEVKPSAPETHTAPAGGSSPTAVRAPLTVLNNTTVKDLAHNVARDFSSGGWSVVRVGNYTGKIPATTVYFTPGNAAEERAARALASEFPQIGRVLPRYEGLPPSVHGVIVVITPDWLNAR